MLGIARPTYRLGLQRALPHDAQGRADVDAWQALGAASQAMLRALPPGSPLAVQASRGAEADPAAAPGARRPAGRGVRAALWLVALATLAGLAASVVLEDPLPEGLDSAPDRVLSEPLPPAESPAGRYADAEALALHPDLALVLDGGDDDALADPAFHAWLHAVADAEADPEEAGRTGLPEAAAATATLPEPSTRPASERLQALDVAARERLAARIERWDARSAAGRGALRERWLAWAALPAAERAMLRDAAARHAARTPDEQAALRARFDALDASERRGWLLGPDLGADYPRLHPLVAQVPEEAREPLLDALRGLDAQARDDLAVLAARVPPQDRAELRVQLLATPAEQRSRWLRRRVAGR